jgi:predicted glycosyltransferase involved in capsule biosynthesis
MSTILIIPYRDREEHLKYFKNNAIPLLKKYIPDIKIIVAEQVVGKPFNRGKLLNVGILEYADSNNSHIITHDVDTIPSESMIKQCYTIKPKGVLRLYSAHNSSFGGIMKFNKEVFIKMNGYPNDIWGWGIEDRALFYRTKIFNFTVLNEDNRFKNQIRVLPHKNNANYYTGDKKKQSDLWRPYILNLPEVEQTKFIIGNGLDDIKYKVISKEVLDGYEKIFIDL